MTDFGLTGKAIDFVRGFAASKNERKLRDKFVSIVQGLKGNCYNPGFGSPDWWEAETMADKGWFSARPPVRLHGSWTWVREPKYIRLTRVREGRESAGNPRLGVPGAGQGKRRRWRVFYETPRYRKRFRRRFQRRGSGRLLRKIGIIGVSPGRAQKTLSNVAQRDPFAKRQAVPNALRVLTSFFAAGAADGERRGGGLSIAARKMWLMRVW